jgi:hypothetical protein
MYIDDFIKITINPNAVAELKIEMIGLLSHMRLGDVWKNYIKGPFFNFITFNLDVTQQPEEDIVLETLGLVSNLCASKVSCKIIAESQILAMLPRVMDEKQEDDEFVLQILYILYKMFGYELGVKFILGQSKLINFCIELIEDTNKKLTTLTNQLLDLIMVRSFPDARPTTTILPSRSRRSAFWSTTSPGGSRCSKCSSSTIRRASTARTGCRDRRTG